MSGAVLVRKMKKLPRSKCWFVGYSKEEDGVGMASEFNKNWDSNLRVGVHDCRDYTNEAMRREGMKEELSLPSGPITRSRAKKLKESLQIYVEKLLQHMEDQNSIKT
ncbi:uncharacterized protein G2W53_013949 [Senna tora]|uniref:Uncharacterized protein n=1 Tax=Senna tora TaxID=362788 RepID=A0A834U290_9FABA|nr:uncharacterized protein G2W53_013949 [Senna tora]